MRIAIITFFENGNLGSELQAYALREFCKKRGHECFLCAIKPKTSIQRLTSKSRKILTGFFIKLVHSEYNALEKAIKNNLRLQYVTDSSALEYVKNWSREHNDIVQLTKTEFCKDQFDCYICGSDQIWSPAIIPLRTELYLKGIKKCKKVAYAPSIGMDWIPQYYLKRVFPLIADFKALSFREIQSVHMCEENGLHAELVLDPTLLVGKTFWDARTVEVADKYDQNKGSFYLCYFLGKPCKETIQELNQIGKNNKICVVNTTELAEQICNAEYLQVNPIEFVYIISVAKGVLTDSFHGVVFSIMYHKHVRIYQRTYDPKIAQKSRIASLLTLLGIEKNYSETANALELFPDDYNRVDEIIQIYQEKSREYLENALGN